MEKSQEEANRQRDVDRSWAMGMLAKLQYDGWFGTFEVKVERGQVVRVETHSSHLPPRLLGGAPRKA